MPPSSRRWVIRSSMAAMTCGTHWPLGSSAVGQRLLVAVGVVGTADQAHAPLAVVALEAVLLVAHEGDALVGLGAEGRPGQAQPARGEAVGLLDRLAPGEAVTGVVHLVEDDQRLHRGGAGGVQHRLARDLR